MAVCFDYRGCGLSYALPPLLVKNRGIMLANELAAVYIRFVENQRLSSN